MPRGLLEKRHAFDDRAVKNALVASAAHDPLAADGAYAFLREAVGTIVPPGKTKAWLGAAEPRLVELAAVLAAAPALYEREVIARSKLYPSAENATTSELPFFLQLANLLQERASTVEADPVSAALRVSVVDASRRPWPSGRLASHGSRTRRGGGPRVTSNAPRRMGRTRVARLKAQRAHDDFGEGSGRSSASSTRRRTACFRPTSSPTWSRRRRAATPTPRDAYDRAVDARGRGPTRSGGATAQTSRATTRTSALVVGRRRARASDLGQRAGKYAQLPL